MKHSMGQALSFAQKKDLQRSAKDLSDPSQLELLEKREPKISAEVDRRYLFTLPSLRRAIRYSMSLRDLEPKQVYERLGKDAAAWSRIENGGISFPSDDLPKLLEITGNDAPLRWIAHACGFEIQPLRTELEQRLEAEKARADELQRQNDLMRELLGGRK